MKRVVSTLAAVVSSLLSHAVLAWALLDAPEPILRPARVERFEVRMLELPEPVPVARAEPPPPLPAPAQPALPRPKPRPLAAPPAPTPPLPTPPSPNPPRAEAVEPSAPPAALLDLSTVASSIGVVAGTDERANGLGVPSAAPSRPAPEPAREPAPPRFAKLGDLSQKPRAPSLDSRLRQNYPTELRRRGVAGQAQVGVFIDARGRVEALELLAESAPGFGRACEQTLRGSLWSEPLDRHGEPVRTRIVYRCRFEIDH